MLTLSEHIEIEEKLKLFEGESSIFTDEQLDAAESYEMKWVPYTGQTELYLYDVDDNGLGSVTFDDADIAIAFLEEYFELDDEELDDLESYSWATGVELDDDDEDYQDDGDED